MKKARKAIGINLFSLFVCISLLIGTTLSWFTDQATSGVNKIIAGNLDVDLVMWNGDEYVSISGEDSAIFGNENSLVAQNDSADTLWEPGKTQIVYLGVRNNGNLALKYNIVLNIIDGGLIGALEYAILDGVDASAPGFVPPASWDEIKAISGVQTGDVVAGTIVAAQNGVLDGIAQNPPIQNETDYFALAVHMKEDAGNEYMGKDITIDVTVVAGQMTAESDSFGNDYDKDSKYTMPDFYVNNTSQLVAAINDAEPGDIIKLQAEGTYVIPSGTKDLVITGSADTVIDLTGTNSHMENVTFEGVTFECGNTSYHGYQHSNNLTFRNCTIKGTYWSYAYNTKFIGCTFINTDSENYNIWTYGSRYITFDNCTFISAGRSVLIYVEGGPGQDAVFRNCTFEATYTVADKAAIEIDSSYISGTYTVIVDNGTTATGFGNIGQVSGLINNKKGTRTTIIYNGVTVLSAS